MKRHLIRIKETIATLIADDEFTHDAEKYVREVRGQILDYILENPEFEYCLTPVKVSKQAPQVVQKMAEAGQIANVGPMAGVAGAIAEYVVEELIASGARHILFDNGGDIAMFLDSPAVVGIYAGNSSISNLGFLIEHTQELLSVCTSSGTVGHSLSFGVTDASIVISKNGALADASATVLGNFVKKRDQHSIERALEKIDLTHLDGLMVIAGDIVGVRGTLPRLVRVNVPFELISMG
jgi:hypothetical protein